MKILNISLLISALFPFSMLAEADRTSPSPDVIDRQAVPANQKWNMELFYPSCDAWEADLASAEAQYMELAGFQGRLEEGPETLRKVLELYDSAGILLDRLYGFAAQNRDLDTHNNEI